MDGDGNRYLFCIVLQKIGHVKGKREFLEIRNADLWLMASESSFKFKLEFVGMFVVRTFCCYNFNIVTFLKEILRISLRPTRS